MDRDRFMLLGLAGFFGTVYSGNSSIYSGRYPNNYCFQSIGFCGWQRYIGAYMLWFLRHTNDGTTATIIRRSLRHTKSAGYLFNFCSLSPANWTIVRCSFTCMRNEMNIWGDTTELRVLVARKLEYIFKNRVIASRKHWYKQNADFFINKKCVEQLNFHVLLQ